MKAQEGKVQFEVDTKNRTNPIQMTSRSTITKVNITNEQTFTLREAMIHTGTKEYTGWDFIFDEVAVFSKFKTIGGELFLDSLDILHLINRAVGQFLNFGPEIFVVKDKDNFETLYSIMGDFYGQIEKIKVRKDKRDKYYLIISAKAIRKELFIQDEVTVHDAVSKICRLNGMHTSRYGDKPIAGFHMTHTKTDFKNNIITLIYNDTNLRNVYTNIPSVHYHQSFGVSPVLLGSTEIAQQISEYFNGQQIKFTNSDDVYCESKEDLLFTQESVIAYAETYGVEKLKKLLNSPTFLEVIINQWKHISADALSYLDLTERVAYARGKFELPWEIQRCVVSAKSAQQKLKEVSHTVKK